MVKITNGISTFSVTSGAFESIFKHQGYKKVEEPKKEQQSAERNGEVDGGDDMAEFVEAMVEKPIAQWTASETKDFAKAKGINIAGTKNVAEAKEIIKKHIGL